MVLASRRECGGSGLSPILWERAMPVIFRGHGPLPQWTSDVRFCLKPSAAESTRTPSGQGDIQHLDAARLRVVPLHIHIPQPCAVTAFGRGLLIGRAWILRQALLDQLYQLSLIHI